MAQTPSTTPLGLNQWGLEDDVRIEQFSADNLIIDTALAGKADLSTPGATNWDSGNFSIETGTWNPKIAGTTTAGNHTYTTATTGLYYKIGNLVYVSARIQLSAKDTSMAGNCKVIGFPFSATSAFPSNFAMNIGFTSYLTLTAEDKQFSILLNGGDGTLFTLRSGADRGTIPASAITSNTAIYFSGVYPIN